MRRPRTWRIAALGLALALGACGSEPQGVGLDCFPKDARRWLAAPKADEGAARTNDATIYVDHSGSMAGFVAGNAFNRPFTDLIGTLPDTLRSIGLSPGFRSFGRMISDRVTDGKRFADAAFYKCNQPDLAKCDNQESHLDEVLRQVRDDGKGFAVILTDLWFNNSEVTTTGVSAMQPLLAGILAQGRAIGIYGTAAPFNGRITDLPAADGTRSSVDYRGRHPLFVVVIGTKEQVTAFGLKLPRSGSAGVAEASQGSGFQRAIFVTDPTAAQAPPRQPLTPGRSPALRQEKFDLTGDVPVQQFVFVRGDVPLGAGPVAGPSWTGPDDAGFIADSAWRGPLEPVVRLWSRRDTRCTADSWNEQQPLDADWAGAPGDGQRTLILTPALLAQRMTAPGGVYLLTAELRRQSVLGNNPAAAWMRSDWSLRPEQATAVAGAPPPLFPTLNLSEFARLMENALADAAERKASGRGGGDAVAGFAVMLKAE